MVSERSPGDVHPQNWIIEALAQCAGAPVDSIRKRRDWPSEQIEAIGPGEILDRHPTWTNRYRTVRASNAEDH